LTEVSQEYPRTKKPTKKGNGNESNNL